MSEYFFVIYFEMSPKVLTVTVQVFEKSLNDCSCSEPTSLSEMGSQFIKKGQAKKGLKDEGPLFTNS